MFKSLVNFVLGLKSSRKVKTEHYPDRLSSRSEIDLPPRTRGTLSNNLSACTGCGDCVRVCPAKCIDLTLGEVTRGKHDVELFSIDYSKCVFCGECVLVCEPKSLVQSVLHEKPQINIKDLLKESRLK